MMKKQLRILIGDTGCSFSVAMANAFCTEGDWAIVRPQTEEDLFGAVQQEHPDVLILDENPASLDLTEFVPLLRRRFDTLTVIALMHRQNSFTEKTLCAQGVMCRRFPENPAELRAEIRKLFDRSGAAIRIDLSEPDLRLTRLLQSTGIPAHLQGFHFLRCAIRHALNEPYCSGCMMHRIYPAVAAEMNSTPTRVERSIRHAIAHAWESAQADGMPYPFPSKKRRMTNSEFIAAAVEYLRSSGQQRVCG